MTTYYGRYDHKKQPLAAHVWGHRLRTGQHWIEYMLEFLSVLSGFEYHFGQGLLDRPDDEDYQAKYRIPHRLGLRRFVFYDEREKSRHSHDTDATNELRRRLATLIHGADGRSDDAFVEQVRSLLRSFSAIEDDRSWFAKTLFPVHEAFLLWEGQRKRSSGAGLLATFEDADAEIEFTTRNFFARGGELYYLIISAGTESQPEKRQFISQRLKSLLTQQNDNLGRIAHTIDAAWYDQHSGNHTHSSGSLGWILDPDCALYRQIADDLACFLDNDLDSLECLELLAHLISFHIICYIYHRAHPASHAEGHASGSCLEVCRPLLLVDLPGQQDGGVIREQSAGLLREQDDLQLRQARDMVSEKLYEWAGHVPSGDELSAYLIDEANHAFQLKRSDLQALEGIQAQYHITLDREQLLQGYTSTIFDAMSAEFRKNFLGVHRKLGRAIGLIAPRKGPQNRYVLGDTLLKTLVMAMLPPSGQPQAQLSFGAFLEKLYARYGIIVGPGEAHTTGLIERLRINEEYYARNRDMLRERMQRAGLLTQYSDATAMVQRREAALL